MTELEKETQDGSHKRPPIIIAVKKWNKKDGKLYGPYPKDPDEYYLYEQRWDPEKGLIMKYLGRGKKPEGAIVKEVTGVSDFFRTGETADENHPATRSRAADQDPGRRR